MADKAINELTAASTLDGTELVHVEQSSNSRKATVASISVSTKADAAAVRGKTADRLLDVPGIYAAHVPVTLTDAATIAVDMDTGTVFTVTLGGNRTLGNPTNADVGQSGLLRVVQDGTGSRTLALSSDWKTAGATAPDLSSGAGEVDLFSYYVYAANTIYLFPLGKDFS